MRNKFDQELEQLNDNLLKMGAIIERAIGLAIDGLEQMQDYSAQIQRLEMDADTLEHTIEGQCMHIILSQQPVARDLRITTTAMKMITDMERIADQAVDISEISRHLLTRGAARPPQAISPMAKKAVTMVNNSIDAFIRKDLALAEEIIATDDVVDSFFLQIREEIIAGIRQGASDGSAAIDYVMIAKYLERIADHAVNLAEWVVFLITGLHKNTRII